MSGREEREGWRLSLKRRWRRWKLKRKIAEYLREVLSPRLELVEWRPLPAKNKYRRLFFTGKTPGGRVFCKFYRGKTAEYIARHMAIDRLLRQAGAATPEIVFADHSRETLDRYGLGCLVTRWVESVVPPNNLDLTAAIENLARLHAVRSEDVDAAIWQSHGGPIEDPLPPGWGAENAAAMIQDLDGEFFKIDIADRERVLAYFARGARLLETRDPGAVLLHLDYTRNNLIVDEKGTLHTIDFELVRFGWWGYDLAQALLTLTSKGESVDPPFERIHDVEPGRGMLEAYFAIRGEADREVWEEARPWVMAWAYLRVLTNLAKKSRNEFRFGAGEREGLVNLAGQRWRRLLAWIRAQHPPTDAS